MHVSYAYAWYVENKNVYAPGQTVFDNAFTLCFFRFKVNTRRSIGPVT